jgi:ligand-binding sensor domain-containing protein
MLPLILFISVSISLKAQNWTNYNSIDNITCMAIDPQGNTWIGTDGGGIFKFDGTNWENYTYPKVGRSPIILSIAVDAQGNKWIGTVGGLLKFDGTNWVHYENKDILRSATVLSIAIDAQGNKWLGTRGDGLIKFDGTNWTAYKTSSSPSYIHSIAIDAQGNKWVGSIQSNLYKFDDTNWMSYRLASNALVENYVSTIVIDAQGNKWVGVQGSGLFKFDDVNWVSYTKANTLNGLVSNSITTIAIDAQGNKWIGSEDKGISKFDGTNWTKYTRESNNLPSNAIGAISIDGQGNAWIGFSNEGAQNGGFSAGAIVKFNGTSWTNYKPPINFRLRSAYVNALAIDAQGSIWFATRNSVSKFDDISWVSYNNYSNNNLETNITTVAVDANGDKWFGTSDGNLLKFNGSTWTHYYSGQSYRINAIAFDKNGDKWVATDNGIFKFNGSTWIRVIHPTETGKIFSCIAIDKQNNIWFGGPDAGVLRFDRTNWIQYRRTTANDPKPQSTGSIAMDNDGSLWFTTPLGVSKFDGTNWTIFPKELYTYRSNSALVIDKKGNKWLGGKSGEILKLSNDNTWTSYTPYPYKKDAYNPIITSIALDVEGNKWIGTDGMGAYKLLVDDTDPIDVNLVQNGDFEQGNVGFTTDLKYLSTSDMSAGIYTVGDNTNLWQNNFANCTKNHTLNGKFMFIANGATTPNHKVWSQTVTVKPNTSYKLSMWYTNVSDFPDNQKLQFKVNGVLIGQTSTNPPTLCEWANLQTFWNSGGSTTAVVEVINATTAFLGNDFALDDIFMTPITTVCPVVPEITITNLIPKLNQDIYQVKEGATIHHYFLVYDKIPTLLKGVVIRYKIKDKIYKSLPSDDKGLVDLNIKLSGIKEDNLNDDILRGGAVERITFEGIEGICPNSISVNQFEHFTIKVDPFEGNDLTKGIYQNTSLSAGACANCVGAGPFGASASTLTIGKGQGFDFAWRGDNISSEWTIIMSDDVDVTLNADAGVGVFELEASAGIKQSNTLRLPKFKLRTKKDYLIMLYLLSKSMF